MAPGTAVSGLAKWALARETARVEFCIMTSILMVRAVSSGARERRARIYAIKPPNACMAPMARTRRGPTEANADALAATTAAHMSVTAMTEKKGSMWETALTVRGDTRLRNMPRNKGMRTTCVVERKRPSGFTGTSVEANRFISNGMKRTERRVEMRVRTTESGTLAPARRQTTLLAVPPGETPTRMTPAARGGGRERRRETMVARRGIRVYWAATPRRTRRGVREMAMKEEGEMVRPMPSMMKARVGTM